MAEVYTSRFVTSLTTGVTSTTRPATLNVGATLSALGGGTFSCAVYDAGTDVNPTHYECFEVTSGGNTLAWSAITETGFAATTHSAGSTVVATILTPRSLQQPMTDHTREATTPDPHVVYIRKGTFTAKGGLLVGTGNGTFAQLPVGNDGMIPVADSSQMTGVRWIVMPGAAVVQLANAVYAGPASGQATYPSFRALTEADLPVHGRHEEFVPAASETTVTLAAVPQVVLTVARAGLVLSQVAGDYTFSSTTMTFATAFDGSTRVVVAYIG